MRSFNVLFWRHLTALCLTLLTIGGVLLIVAVAVLVGVYPYILAWIAPVVLYVIMYRHVKWEDESW